MKQHIVASSHRKSDFMAKLGYEGFRLIGNRVSFLSYFIQRGVVGNVSDCGRRDKN